MRAPKSLNLLLALLLLCLSAVLAGASNVPATDGRDVVRVGMMQQEGFATAMPDGTVRGFDAEYMSKIAQYAGLRPNFQLYTNASEMLDDLAAGKIDMALGIAWTPERAERFLFAEKWFLRGTVAIRVRPDDGRYDYGNAFQLASARIGAEAGGSMHKMAMEWAASRGIALHVTEYNGEQALRKALDDGEIDAIVTNGMRMPEYRTILQFTTDGYYPVFRKNWPGLCVRVDAAMARILNENELYPAHLVQKYVAQHETDNMQFTDEEKAYIAAHPTVSVAVVRGTPPFYNDADGSGIVTEFYDAMGKSMGMTFSYQVYDSAAEATEAVRSGKVDVLGMTHDDVIAASQKGLILTSNYLLMNIMRIYAADTDTPGRAAVLAQDEAVMRPMLEHYYPGVSILLASDLQDAYRMMESGQVECLVCCEAQGLWVINQHREGEYTALGLSGMQLEHCGALAPNRTTLANVLSKAAAQNKTQMPVILAHNISSKTDVRTTLQRLPVQQVILISVLLLLLVSGVLGSIIYALREKARASKEAQDVERVFFSGMSHDLRTPLNGILGYAELAMEQDVSERVQGYLAQIRSSGRIMLDLVNNILDLSKFESGKMDLSPAPFSVDELYQSVCSSIQMVAAGKLAFTSELDAPPNLWLNSDRIRLQQIAMNLLGNAVKYTSAGGRVRFHLLAEPAGKTFHLRMHIEDNGIGMSEEFQRHMYDAFAREAGQPNRANAIGSGLGLALVKRFTDLLGGTITLKSALNEGTTFILDFQMPVAAEAMAAAEAKMAVPEHTAKPAATPAEAFGKFLADKRLLLCEDNDINAQLAQIMLAGYGLTQIVRAHNGQEGWNLYMEKPEGYFDLILMDIRMPIMGGHEAARRIRAAGRADSATIPIIALTADAAAGDVEECRSSGMNGWVSKPIHKDTLAAALHEELARRQAVR